MELAMWLAARRLRALVLVAFVCAAVPFARDPRIGTFSAACGILAVVLLSASVVPMALASRRMRRGSSSTETSAPVTAYRTSGRADDSYLVEHSATRPAACAFVLLSLSGALLVVTAAAR
jgi:hypothetical protein